MCFEVVSNDVVSCDRFCNVSTSLSWTMRFCTGFPLINLIAWYILVLSLWHLSVSYARLSRLRFLSSFNTLGRCVFNFLTFSLLTVEVKWRRSSFCWFDKRSATGLFDRWILLFLVKPIVFVAALVILARIFSHEVHAILQKFSCNCCW